MALFAPLNSIRFLAQKPTPLPTSPTNPSRISLLPRRISSRSRSSVVLSSAGNGSAGDMSGKEKEEEEEIALVEEKVVFDAYPLLEKRSKEEEEAMRKCREILFRDFSRYLGVSGDEIKALWAATEAAAEDKEGEEERKLESVKEFLAQWGSRYLPLSPKFAKEMLEDYITAAGSSPDR